MAWLESHQDLGEHPKTKRLARLLGISLPAAVGHLHYLWWWALDFAQDGDVTAYSAEEIAEAAHWDGEPGTFYDALFDCRVGDGSGFLEETDEGRRLIHDWYDYAGKLMDRKRRNAEQMRQARARAHAANVSSTCNTRDATCKATTTVPNRTIPGSGGGVPQAKITTLDGEPVPETNAYALYLDQHGGRLGPLEAEALKDLVGEFTDQWVAAAIEDAVKCGKTQPSINYLTSILQRWQRDGFRAPFGGNGRKPTSEPQGDYLPNLGRNPDKGVL